MLLAQANRDDVQILSFCMDSTRYIPYFTFTRRLLNGRFIFQRYRLFSYIHDQINIRVKGMQIMNQDGLNEYNTNKD